MPADPSKPRLRVEHEQQHYPGRSCAWADERRQARRPWNRGKEATSVRLRLIGSQQWRVGGMARQREVELHSNGGGGRRQRRQGIGDFAAKLGKVAQLGKDTSSELTGGDRHGRLIFFGTGIRKVNPSPNRYWTGWFYKNEKSRPHIVL